MQGTTPNTYLANILAGQPSDVRVQFGLESSKRPNVLPSKETVLLLKTHIWALESAILDAPETIHGKRIAAKIALEQRIPASHVKKLTRLIDGIANPLEFTTFSIYTEEAEVGIVAMIDFNKRIFMVSEGGNVPTTARVAYKLVKLIHDLRTKTLEEIRPRIEAKYP